jgi:hypothetical protein
MAWDKDKPAGSQKLRLADDDIRANNTAIDDVFNAALVAGTALTATIAEVNTACDGITATATEINTACDGVTATASEINTACDGVTATAAEINKSSDGIGVTIPRQKVIEIGDWNLDSSVIVNVSHGLSASKIIGVTGIIRNDLDTQRYTISQVNEISEYDAIGVVFTYIGSFIQIGRQAGSATFDTTDFDSTSYNRGWLIVSYLD